MASGHVNRANRPNTWLHRPMLHRFKKVLANSEPSTHGGKADMCYVRNWPKADIPTFPPTHPKNQKSYFPFLAGTKKAAVLSDRGCNLGRQLFGGRGCWQPASNNVHAAFMAPLLTWLLGQELWNPTGSIGIVRSRE